MSFFFFFVFPPPSGSEFLAGDGLVVGLLAFLNGTAGDQLVEGDWDWTGDGSAGGFLAAGSGDPETDREDETLLTDWGLGEAAFFVFLGSEVLETLLMGLELGDGDFGVTMMLLFEQVEDLRSEER